MARVRVEKNNDTVSNAEKIKAAALKLFGKYGYGSTTVRMIAKEAGLSQGQITVHFGSKEELFDSITTEIVEKMNEAYGPIDEELEMLLNKNAITREVAWTFIERIVDMQIDYCLDPDNRDRLMMMYVVIPNSKIVESASVNLQKATHHKIEELLARAIQLYSNKKGYLRSRTISRAANGAIVSFGEHNNFLLDEVYVSSHFPNSVTWMKKHLRDYILASIKAADAEDAEDY